jgi:hypothetical protein
MIPATMQNVTAISGVLLDIGGSLGSALNAARDREYKD